MTAPNITQTAGLPAVAPPAALAEALKAQAGFMDGTDGKGPRLAWARYSVPFGGYGWSTGANVPYAITMGGQHAREAPLASAVANDLATSNPALATILDNLEVDGVGTGLTLSSKPDAQALGISDEAARALSHAIETKWAAWINSPIECDYVGRFDGHQIAAAAYRAYLLNGETLATLEWARVPGATTRTKVNLLDNRQLDTTITRIEDGRKVLSGVAFNDRGQIAGFYLRSLPLGNTVVAPMAQFVPARTSWGRVRVAHIFELRDPRQVRGLSPLIAALTPAQEKESLGEFTLANAMLQTQFALTVESDLPPQHAFGSLEVNDAMSIIDGFVKLREERYSQAKIQPQPGVVNHLAPGDKLKFNKVENPHQTFDAFDKSLTRKAARAAGLAYEQVSGDFASTSFSASRMAMEAPHRINMKRRRNILERFYRIMFEAWAEEMFETGQIETPEGAPPFWQAREAYCAGKFLGIGRFEPDPKKAVEADVLALENNIETLEDVLARRGRDLETHLAQVAAERALMAQYGLTFKGVVTTQDRNETIEEDDEAPKAARHN
ncbi:lambda family phage portal protein [Rhodoblastus acidophilus]|uniref:phage portal protein n=1 Tax=Rhodoblastus acidophilus TaxID=1074 RepID=UPI002224CFF1|nr:phage portal protein [Rhodoblastus acidophilus]MCW2284904.1 lambda family phage portal protein [Rhodoblastus acidophilus]MCW2333806.1 lambda family phage portal protein [Rhodoblastus acidophilus]